MIQPVRFQLKDFEGPLDLLLFLIREHELDIRDIPIVEVTRQYLSWMDQIDDVDLEAAGDYILMSATLLQIKARMLLPRSEEEGEPVEDPRHELVQRLLEYRQFREVSQWLAQHEPAGRDCWPRRWFDLSRIDPEVQDDSLREVDLYDLAGCYAELVRRPPRRVRHDVELFRFSIEDQVRAIREHGELGRGLPLRRLLGEEPDRELLVVSLLAVLDMARSREVLARQAAPERDIWLFDPQRVEDWLLQMRDRQ
jgi:segregation and condensation protein A